MVPPEWMVHSWLLCPQLVTLAVAGPDVHIGAVGLAVVEHVQAPARTRLFGSGWSRHKPCEDWISLPETYPEPAGEFAGDEGAHRWICSSVTSSAAPNSP